MINFPASTARPPKAAGAVRFRAAAMAGLITFCATGCSEETNPVAEQRETAMVASSSEGGEGGQGEPAIDGGSVDQESSTTVTTLRTLDTPTISSDHTQPRSSSGEPSETAWVVVVAGASDPYDSLLVGAMSELEKEGFETQITNCDLGAADALQMSNEGTFTVSAYFVSEVAASEGQEQLAQAGLEGVLAEITTRCPE